MPIAQGDVVDLFSWQGRQVDQVVSAGLGLLVALVVPPPEAMHAAMGEHDARPVGGQSAPVQPAQPLGWITAVLVAQQRAGQHHGRIKHQWLALKQQLQVGGRTGLVSLEVIAEPHRARGAVVMVAGDNQYRHRHLADQLEYLQHRRGIRRG